MTSSKAKKSAKKADFQKSKLKVAKTRPKATNVTDTSFRTRGIVVKEQSVSLTSSTLKEQVHTHVFHLGSRSESQRKESLAALVNIAQRTELPVHDIVEHTLPLITDGSVIVREQLIRLLNSLTIDQCQGYETKVILYLQLGLTHISSAVCRSTLEVLEWATRFYRYNIVSCPGGWFKTLKCFLLLLGWPQTATANLAKPNIWSATGAAMEKFNKEPKFVARVLESFATFISLGLSAEALHREAHDHHEYAATVMCPNMLPQQPRPYARLDLFQAAQLDNESQAYEDADARRNIFNEAFRIPIQQGLEAARGHGGDLGRAAGRLATAIQLV